MSGSTTPAPAPLAPETNSPVSATGNPPTPNRIEIASRPFPAPAEFSETRIYLGFIANNGDDSKFKSVQSDDSDATATPADPLAEIMQCVFTGTNLSFHLVGSVGNHPKITDAYADGSERALPRLYLRRAAANQLMAMLDVLREVDPTLGLVALTGAFDTTEAAAHWRCNFRFACGELGFNPLTTDDAEIKQAGDFACTMTGLPPLLEADFSDLDKYRTALGLRQGNFLAHLPGTKTGGMSAHLMLTKKGFPVFNGISYDGPDCELNDLDWFERHTADDLATLMHQQPRVARYALQWGVTQADGITSAFEEGRRNRRIFTYAALTVGALPISCSSTFISFGDESFCDYTRAAMMGLSTATMTSLGTSYQLEIIRALRS